ncbi:MAG: hypothetical protein DHS20C18_01170 [Saprospiraceae bacterium]|nr:MAG: hypothetical protein DHS20C18_01170 [Saprospiraceae bacterium]
MREKIIAAFCLSILFGSVLSAKSIRFRCMWRDDPSTTMVVGWDQVSGNRPVLYYGPSDQGTNCNAYPKSKQPDQVISAKGMNNHFVRLSGLIPNTVYYFVIKDSEGLSQRYSFKTVPNDPEKRLSIIAGGDSRNHREARCNANMLVSKLRPHCVMFDGDMTADDTAPAWRNWFDDWQYTIGSDGRLFPIIAARGNHEASNQSIADLFDVKHEELYYALNLGGDLVRIYTLNSLLPASGNQKAWLEKDLKNNSQITWKLAQYHNTIRPHTSSKPERDDLLLNWATLFYKYQVNLAIESDAHVVKWTYPIRPSREPGSEEGFIRDDIRGTVYIGEGGWGAPLRASNDNKSWTRDSGSFNQFKWIFIDQYGIEIRTIRTDGANRVAEVNHNNIFNPPIGLVIWSPSNGDVVKILNSNPPPPAVQQELLVSKKPNPNIPPAKDDWAGIQPLDIDFSTGGVSVDYKLKTTCDVTIILINKEMKEVTRALLKGQAPGPYIKKLDMNKISAGEYLLIIKANNQVIRRCKIKK